MEKSEKMEGKEENKKEEKTILKDNDGEVDAQDESRIVSTRLIALFIVGALVGITLKTHAIQTITMGFEDYKLGKYKSDFGLSVDEEQQEEDTLEPEVEEEPETGEMQDTEGEAEVEIESENDEEVLPDTQE